jgi:hypothetical protein
VNVGLDPVSPGTPALLGEDENTVVLEKAPWNVLVGAIQSGELGRVSRP